MRIAIVGTRGVPARYGGFETFADKISSRLADLGHEVTVYCRRSFTSPDDSFDPRVHRKILPSVCTKHLDTLSHTFLSILHVLFTDAEVVLLCNVANSPFAWIPRVFGKPVILNVDGLDRKRKKWNWLGRLYLLACEILSVVTPSKLVTDAETIKSYFWKKYRKRSEMIAYGAEVPRGLLDWMALGSSRNSSFCMSADWSRRITRNWSFALLGGSRRSGPLSLSAGIRTTSLTFNISNPSLTRESSSPGLFTGNVTGNCRKMQRSMCAPPRLGEPIQA